MNTRTRIFPATIGLSIVCGSMAALALCGRAAAGEPDAEPVRVADYTIFVDPPTGFAFAKLPTGWKFVGRITEAEVGQLPGTVVTSLLKREPASGAMAAAPAPASAESALASRRASATTPN